AGRPDDGGAGRDVDRLLARRRRHKTVHFGDTILADIPSAASEGGGSSSAPGSVVSLPGQFDYNVQQLFTFIGTVLSAWDGDNSSPPHSASSSFRSKRSRQPAARKRRDPLQFLLNGDLELDVAENLGSPIFKHKHWRIAAGSCNALFLRK
ncbi:hypothetical protein LSTR_LSTR016273, partial [Laodelphax striatellus]